MTVIKDKILRYHRKKTRLLLIGGVLNLLVLYSVIWCSTVFLDMAFYFSEATRWFVLFFNGGLSIFLLNKFLLIHIFQSYVMSNTENYVNLTKEIGNNYEEVQDKLTNIYQLENADIPNYSKNLKDYASKKFNEKIKSYDFTQFLKFEDFVFPKHIVAAVLVSTTIALVMLSGAMSNSIKRILIPYKDFSIIPEFTFTVNPGNSKIIKGDSEKISADYSGPKIEDCTILYKNENDTYWQSAPMQFINNIYEFTLADIRNDTKYKINGIVEPHRPWHNKIFSDLYEIMTLTPPQIDELQVTIYPPAYTKLPVKYLEKNVGDIIAYKGSKCELSAVSNKTIQKAELVFDDGSIFPLLIREQKVSGKISVNNPGSFLFRFTDSENVINQNPIKYSITVLEDEYPAITILEPENEIEAIPDAVVNLQFEGNDDFGFSDIKLFYQVMGTEEEADSIFTAVDIPIDLRNLKYFSNNYLWDLSNLPIGFDESIKYYMEISDNDEVNGPKKSKSKYQLIRFPSLDQLFEEFAETEDKNTEEMEDIASENEKLQKELEKIQREFKQDKQLNWERKKEIESTIKKQEELQKKINNIEREIEEAVKKLAEKNLMSPEVLEKYNQLQELFQEIASPELLQAMQELQKSIEVVDKKKVEQALNKMSFNQKQFKEKLERTLELFKKIQLEQEMDRLVQMAKRLTQKQEEISENIENKKKENEKTEKELAQKQSQQSENFEQLNKASENVLNNEDMKAFQQAWEKLNEANNFSNEQQIQNQMNQMQNQISQNNMKQASSTSKSLQHQLEQLLEKLQQSQAAMNQQNKNEVMAKMRKAANNLLRLSRDEEELMNETHELSNLSDEFRDKAQKQNEISGNMQKVIKDIVEISKETFFLSPKTGQIMGQIYGNMGKGISALEERNKNGATSFQKQAMSGLNRAVMEMQNSMQSASQSQSGMGFEQFMQQMQQMAGQQGQLNQQGMSFMQRQGNFGQLNLSQQGELTRMAAQQEAIRKSMQQLNDQMGERSDILGRMDNIGEEMKKVVEDMQKMKYDQKTIQRQQNILSRMLDAQKSVRERKYSKKRTAEVGKQYARKNPSELQDSIDAKKEQLRKELMRALNEGYSIDYEKLIEEYFRKLNSQVETN